MRPNRFPLSELLQSLCICFMLLLACGAKAQVLDRAAGNLPAESPSAVRSLGYGVMLYEYFQGHHFDTLVEHAIADQRNDLGGHQDYPNLISGGEALAFGMDRYAADTFNTLLDGSYSDGVESQAWFYLGKIAFQRRNLDRAEQVLGRVNKHLPRRFGDEFSSMVSQLNLYSGRFSVAESRRDGLAITSPYRAYTSFNVGAAYQKDFISNNAEASNGNWRNAVENLDQAAREALDLRWRGVEANDPDEYAALADRALLASGYALLQGKKYGAAVDRFKRVRLKGPYAPQAMLGYGWAEVELGNFEAALTPWQHLLGQKLTTAAVREATMGVPFLYERMGIKAKALSGFENAATDFRQELANIDSAIAVLDRYQMIDLFVQQQGRGYVDWVEARDTLTMDPQSPYLAELLAGHRFQSALTDLRDLNALRSNLKAWQLRVETFSYALESRENARRALRKGAHSPLQERIGEMKRQRSVVYKRLGQAEGRRDAMAVLPEPKHKVWLKLEETRRNLEALQAKGANVSEQKEKADFLAGVMHWEAVNTFAANRWKLRKQLEEVDQIISLIENREESVDRVLAQETDIKSYRKRVVAARDAVEQTIESNESVIARAENELADLVRDKLLAHRSIIEGHLTQTQLAITRLYDQNASTIDAQLSKEAEQ